MTPEQIDDAFAIAAEQIANQHEREGRRINNPGSYIAGIKNSLEQGNQHNLQHIQLNRHTVDSLASRIVQWDRWNHEAAIQDSKQCADCNGNGWIYTTAPGHKPEYVQRCGACYIDTSV